MELVRNKKAGLNYELLEKYDAGMELLGTEVKSLKAKRGALDGAFVIIRGGEAYVTNMFVPAWQEKNAPSGYDPYRTRRLLLNKKEIALLAGHTNQKGLTIVPIMVKLTKNLIKLVFAVARGKKKYDKRETLKKRVAEREAAREAANY